jgi:ABC-type branched-subunit amino acid transport system substrate-binding protein
MKKLSNRSALVGVLCVMSVVFGIALPNPAHAANVITVGTIMPVSGPLSVVGLTWDKGFELAAYAINSDGGLTLHGKKYTIKLIQEDSKASAEAARAAALKLVYRDKVNFVIGGILEPAVEAMYKVCDKAGIFFGMANANIPGGPADVSPDKKLQARLFHSYDLTHAIDIDYLKSAYPEVKTIAISSPEIGYEPMIADLTKIAEAKGLKIIHVEKWQWGTVDFLPTFTRILASSPDAIWAMVSGQAQYQLMAARQLGFKGPFISNSPLAGEVFLRVAGKEACHDLIVNAVNTQDTTDMVKKVMAMWQKKFGGEFISDSLLAYDALWVLSQVVDKAQSLKGSDVMATLETMTHTGDIQTVNGPARFGGLEKYGCNRVLVRPIPLSHFQGDKVVAAEFIQP